MGDAEWLLSTWLVDLYVGKSRNEYISLNLSCSLLPAVHKLDLLLCVSIVELFVIPAHTHEIFPVVHCQVALVPGTIHWVKWGETVAEM